MTAICRQHNNALTSDGVPAGTLVAASPEPGLELTANLVPNRGDHPLGPSIG